MPVILLERIPLPSLRAYTGFSVILLACAVFYAHQFVQTAKDTGMEIPFSEMVNENGVDDIQYLNVSLPYDSYVWNMVYVMTTEAWCVWVSNGIRKLGPKTTRLRTTRPSKNWTKTTRPIL